MNFFNLLLNDFMAVGISLGAVLALGGANTILGLVIAGTANFDKSRLWTGVKKLILLVLSLALIVVGIELLGMCLNLDLIKLAEITVDGTTYEITADMVLTVGELVGILYKGGYYYGKDALSKVNSLMPTGA